ncbi:tetrahydromethanopterin S-methyltransferase subunit G [Pedobacter africanus]|uniref:Tetrahydromethanopterin S-methyltransferase subunit G n=1 Tax=Pedobacter africanus TaxID=151894 RepID=A0ACC6L077_9SPHI|nr:DUF4199 domain-containing protein [Pedobacter africanus]MDR6784835.1 tetrahydromethanopterin S-methyltransferase subunit G [Pedobacter africanus]
MTTQTLENLKPEAAKNGIGLGLISLVLGVISAYLLVNAASMMAIFLVPILIGLLIPLGIAIFFCIDLRKKIGGFWNLRQATSGIFIMFLIAYVISTAGNLVFTKFIEPDMAASIQSTVIDATSEMMQKQGMEQDAIDKKVEEMNADFEKKAHGTVMQNIQGHVIGIIIVFVFALLFGAIFKKEKPLAVFEE